MNQVYWQNKVESIEIGVEPKKRQSNLELLRIVSMGMIIGLHYLNANFGGALGMITVGRPNFYVAYLLESTFIVAVNCFVLITGYFFISKKSISLIKAIGLVGLAIFYSTFFYFLVNIVQGQHVGAKGVLLNLSSFFGRYWFMESYLVLYLLSPFINLCLNRLNKKDFRQFVVIAILLFSVWPSLTTSFAPNADRGYGVISFITIYAIGAYLRKYYRPKRRPVDYLIVYLIVVLVITVYNIAARTFPLPQTGWDYNFVLNVLASVCLFLFFLGLRIKSSAINYVASFAFAVYLIHVSSISKIFYETILHSSRYWLRPWFVFHLFISIISIYIISMLIEMSRRLVVKKTIPLWSFLHSLAKRSR